MSVDTAEVPGVTASAMARSWWAPHGEFGETTVIHVDLAAGENLEAEALALLDEDERARWSEFRHPGSRRRFALCRAALRAILAGQLDCPSSRLAFVATDEGKPYCLVGGEPAPISFNVSHSGSHGLIALAPEGRVGVDVEERLDRQYLDTLVKTVLSRQERSEMEDLPWDLRQYSFLRLWTIKEAIVKAIGVGHRLDIACIETPKSMRRGAKASIFESPALPGITLCLHDLGSQDFAAALAYDVAT